MHDDDLRAFYADLYAGMYVLPWEDAPNALKLRLRHALENYEARQERRREPADPLDRSIRDRHIRDLYDSGMSMAAVANEVGMSPQGVQLVLRRAERIRELTATPIRPRPSLKDRLRERNAS